ncbi:MAG TPA: hypothetical protein VGI70_13645 [Polyangiales bacterium]
MPEPSVTQFDRRGWRLLSIAALPLAALSLAIAQIVAFHRVRSDDAYITYRYGQNIANGLGPVFNPGEHVQGSTSPGHTLLAALVYAFAGMAHTPGIMAAIGCGAWTLESVAVYLLLRDALGALAAGLIALAIGLGASGGAAWVPLDTHFAVALTALGFAAAQRRLWSLAAISCGLAIWARPDAAIAALCVLAACLWDLRWRALRPIGLCAVIALPWPIFAGVYYGSPIPQTAISKFHRVAFSDYLAHELSYPSARLFWSAPAWLVTSVGLIMFVIGAGRLIHRDARLAPFIAYGVLHAIAYSWLRPFIQHGWHLYPWTFVFCVGVLASVAPIRRAGPVPIAQAIALTALLVTAAVRGATDCRTLDRGYWTGQRDAVYRRIADYLRANAEPGVWFASVEVGTIAYFSGLPAYDLGGLVTRSDDAIGDHPVRFIVVDKAYRQLAPPTPPVFEAREGQFMADVFAPRRR